MFGRIQLGEDRRKCLRLFPRRTARWLAVLLVLYLARGIWLPWIGRFLVVSAPLRKADAIYVFAGGEDERPKYAAELLRKQYAPVVVVGSGELSGTLRALGMRMDEAHLNAWALMRAGAPAPRIIMLPYGSSTYEELLQLREYAKKKKMRRLILVSSPFHMRRIAWTARKVFRGSSIALLYAPCRKSRIDLNAWWKKEESLIAVQNEYIKLGYYLLNYIR